MISMPVQRIFGSSSSAAVKHLLKKQFDCQTIKNGRVVLSRHFASGEKVVDSPFGSVDIPEITIQDYIFKDLMKWPEHTALVCAMSGRTYTYGALHVLSKKVAAGFLKSGLQPGQVVALILPNIPEFMICLFAALQAGLVVSTVNPIYGPEEIKHQISNCDASIVITFPAKVPEAKEAISKVEGPKKPPLVVIHQPTDPLPEGTRSFMELLMVQDADEEAVDKVKVGNNDLALLLYSSGTTGLPKGVRLTHRNIVANLTQINHPEIKLAEDTTESHQDSTACVLPFFHVYGLTVGAFTYLSSGLKLVTLPRFEPEMYLKSLVEHKITIAHVVPPLVQFLANHPSVTAKHLATLKGCINGAASVSAMDAQKLVEKKKMVFMSGYGLTESSPVITSAKNTVKDVLTVGSVIGGSQVKLVDTETGQPVDPSKPGEICCRGPQVMQGYHKNPQATAETIKDNWLHTGDVGYFDKDGQLFIVDRIKELIKVKGFQVAPLELEELLKTHDAVADVAVVGKKDARSGEVPVAFVVPTPGKQVSEKEIKDFLASKVAEYKQLDAVVFTKAIPKNATGKILRRELRDSL